MDKEKVLDKFKELFGNDSEFRQAITECSIKREEFLTLEEYIKKYWEDLDYLEEKSRRERLILSYNSYIEDIKYCNSIVDEIGEIDHAEAEREDSEYNLVLHFKNINTFLMGVFRYSSYEGVDYRDGDFYEVLPKKVEVIRWDIVD